MNTSYTVPSAVVERRDVKRDEVNKRGLMGFPVDLAGDVEAQQGLEKLLRSLEGPTVFESPTSPLKLPVTADFSAQMLYYFLVGDYEEHDLRLIRQHVLPGSRVLELGGGVGLTGSMLGMVSGNPVTICEPNAALYASIERTFKANGALVLLVKAAVVADHVEAPTIPFHISRDYWWSSLVRDDQQITVDVPAIRLSEAIQLSCADTLVVDIEGYETELLGDVQCLSGINTLLIEIHTPSIGTAATGALVTNLIRAGFDLVDLAAHTFVFKRPNELPRK